MRRQTSLCNIGGVIWLRPVSVHPRDWHGRCCMDEQGIAPMVRCGQSQPEYKESKQWQSQREERGMVGPARPRYPVKRRRGRSVDRPSVRMTSQSGEVRSGLRPHKEGSHEDRRHHRGVVLRDVQSALSRDAGLPGPGRIAAGSARPDVEGRGGIRRQLRRHISGEARLGGR